jgi:CubicO group peptidase (beta-lactamase class C family)
MMKFLRRVALVLFIALLGFNIYLAVTGKWYFYSALSKTYFIGQKGPGIYDLELFPYRTIKSSANPVELVKIEGQTLLPDELDYLEKWKTTSFLIMRNDTVLFEKYWGEHNETTVSNTFSTAKSVVGLLIGIAVDEGYITHIDEPASLYVKEWNKEGLKEITIRDLLTMSPGTDWHESGGNPFSDNAEAYYGKQLNEKVLQQKLIRKPGEVFEYVSGATQILTMIIENATGQTLSAYFESRIWSKIGTTSPAYWSLDKENGVEKGYCCLYATTRDFAKIGLLILQNGNWAGEQLISENYLQETFKPATLKTLTGKENQRYGLHWWVVPTSEDTIKYARGIQGQYIAVMPSKNIVVVRTGHNRTPDYKEVPEDVEDFPYIIHPQVGHPPDLFEYLRMALRIGEE